MRNLLKKIIIAALLIEGIARICRHFNNKKRKTLEESRRLYWLNQQKKQQIREYNQENYTNTAKESEADLKLLYAHHHYYLI